MKPEISIIIPVYNVRNYLEQCVQSILRQSGMKDRYEILLIDDGSTDGSGQLCDDFKIRYPVIRVIHQKNAGLGAARNTGIKNAAGDFLLFVDADDFICRNSLSPILTEAVTYPADLYFLNSYKYFKNGNITPLNDTNLQKINLLYNFSRNRNNSALAANLQTAEKNGSIAKTFTAGKNSWRHNIPVYKQECMRELAGLSKYPGSACDKLVRRSMIQKHKLYFEENVFCEDLIWVLKCILSAETYRYINTSYYYYRQERPDSISNRNNRKKIRDLTHVIKQGIALSKKQICSPYKKEIRSMMAYETEILLLFLGMLSRKERTSEQDTIKRILWILNYRDTKRTRFIRLILKRFGIGAASQLLCLGYKLRQWRKNYE